MRAERESDTEEWRLLLQDDGGVGDLFADLEAGLRSGLSVEFVKIAEPTYWTEKAVTVAELPTEQRTAVETVVRYGYYETPRAISLTDLAKELNLLRVTLQYHLHFDLPNRRARYAPCILYAALDRSWIDRPCEAFYNTLQVS
jgi:predicted DNA binding protein